MYGNKTHEWGYIMGMKRIVNFKDFINESNGLLKALGAVLTGARSIEDVSKQYSAIIKQKPGSEDSTDSRIKSRIPKGAEDYELDINYDVVPGNDDFALYIQHQQGVAGAAGLIQALNGTGTLHPDTVKTKNGVRYANIVGNVPSDKPQAKRDIIKALDAGDQKAAAAIFINLWKEKWNSFSKKAKEAIKSSDKSKIKEAIQAASKKYGVPFEFALTVAMIESSLNPKAGNARYKGLFAMDPNSTYGGLVKPMGSNWADPQINADNGVKLLKRDIVQLKKQLGKDLASLNLSPWAKNLA